MAQGEQNNKIQSRLITENLRRIRLFSAVLALALPVLFVALLHSSTMPHLYFAIILVAGEIAGIFAFLGSAYMIKSQEFRLALYLHYAFWLLYFVLGLLLTLFDPAADGALIGYCVFLAVYSFLPVLSVPEYTVTMVCQLLLLLVSCLQASVSGLVILLLILLNICFYVLSRYLVRIQNRYFAISQKLSSTMRSAEEDALTGLLNRRGLDKRISIILPHCIRSHALMALLILDIDHFKRYNDSFGHPAGDACIQNIADVLHSVARRGTDIIARIGGEEFVVFVYGTNETEPILLAEKIRSSVEALKIRHSPMLGISAVVTVSVGVAFAIPTDKNSYEELYSEADKALYLAKRSGRNAVICGGQLYGRSLR